jgi:hypothetical protein
MVPLAPPEGSGSSEPQAADATRLTAMAAMVDGRFTLRS